jgi:O-antigen/teichoic acid export membrane protein
VLFDKFKIPTLASSAFKYTAANLINALVPIFLLPILTTYLSKEDYGVVSIFQVLTMVVLPLIGFNAHAALEREYYNQKRNFSIYVTNCLFLLIVAGVTFVMLFLSAQTFLSDLTDFPSEFLWTVPVYCVFHNGCEILLSFWRVHNRASAYGIFRIARTLIEIGVSVLLVVVFSRGWLGRVSGMTFSATLFGLIAVFILYQARTLRFRILGDYIQDILKFGVPLIPHTLGGVIIIYSDRIFITNMLGLTETGSYTVGYQVAMAIYLLQSSFNLAWVPWFYNKLNNKDTLIQKQIVNITYWYFLAILTCALLLTVATPLIFMIFINESYNDSIQFVFWIALGFAFDGMYKMVVNYIFYIKKTYIISFITLGTATLNLILNYFFILRFGAVGAAIATAICMFVEFLIVWVISNRLYPMPWFSRQPL